MKILDIEQIEKFHRQEFAELLLGWMLQCAKTNPHIRREIENCANWRSEIGGVWHDNSFYFKAE
jgi:hypothetical protein